MTQKARLAQWEIMRNALSQNDPITLPKEKIRPNTKFSNLPIPGIPGEKQTRSIEEFQLSLDGFLNRNVLTFKETMSQRQTMHAVILWASTRSFTMNPNGKRTYKSYEYESSLADVLSIFNMADQKIKEIHAANGCQ
jgi:hypothetical protein